MNYGNTWIYIPDICRKFLLLHKKPFYYTKDALVE